MRFALALAALALAAPVQAETWREMVPLLEQETFAIADGGVTVRVTPASPYDDESDATIDVQFPDLPAFRVPRNEHRVSHYGISVGIGRMAPGDATPTVLIRGFSGGAHCCDTLQVVSLVDGKPTAVILPVMDGEPAEAFPTDLDGDGVRDIRWEDDSLLYAFSGSAGGWAVPRIYNLRAGAAADVSRQPGFAPIYRAFAGEALAKCRKREIESAAPCAAYAYAMAVQGRAEEGIRTAVSLATGPVSYPLDCLVEYVDDECPSDQWREFVGFEDALRWIMRSNGYLQ